MGVWVWAGGDSLSLSILPNYSEFLAYIPLNLKTIKLYIPLNIYAFHTVNLHLAHEIAYTIHLQYPCYMLPFMNIYTAVTYYSLLILFKFY